MSLRAAKNGDPVYAVGPAMDYRARRRFAAVVAVIFVTLAAAALLTGTTMLPDIAWFSSALLLCCAFANLGAGLLQLGQLAINQRRSMALLTWLMLGSAGIVFLDVFLLPYSAGRPPLLRLGPQSGAWLHTFWHLYVAGGALAYAWVRFRYDDNERASARFLGRCALGALGVALAGSTATLALASRLPPLVLPGGNLIGIRTSGEGELDLLLGAAAMLAIWRRHDLRRMDHAVALSVLAIWLSEAIVVLEPLRFTLAYYVGRLLDSVEPLFILIAAASRPLEAFSRLGVAATVIDRTQRVALRQSHRMAAIWRLARIEQLSDAQRFQMLLDAAAGAIRPGRPFFGQIGHLDGDDLVIDAASDAHATALVESVGSRFMRAGERIPLAESLQYELAQSGSTLSFNDLSAEDHVVRRLRGHSTPFNSFIGTVFVLGNTQYFVAFASTETMNDDQFTEDDHAFIDVLAAFLAGQLQRDRQLAQIRYQIEHDSLTGLPNRPRFRAAVLKNISLEIPCAVTIVSLDRFREINETFGHTIGDALLVEIAAALRGARQSGDFIARLGGDNFAILIDDVAERTDLDVRLQPYRDVFSQAFGTGDREQKESVRVGATFGVALFPQDGRSFEVLLAHADAAVNSAKGLQRGSVAYFNTLLQHSIERRRTLHVQLAAAVEEGQFTVRYQPTVELWNREIIGAEALVRWQHPRQGLVAPDDFIPFAEANGLIRPIGSWVMERVIADLSSVAPLPERFTCYINLSGQQFGDLDFAAALRDELRTHPAVAGHIGIEITETVAMSDAGRTIDAFALLRELGVTIALDDFGTGYSSLSYLKRFPIDIIKIDKSFVRGIPHDQHDIGLVETVIAVASRFGFKTLAEGVESVEQFDWLRARGCTYGQGYLIAKPMTFTEFAPWLGRRTFTSVRK